MKTNQRKKRMIHWTQPKKLRILTFGVIVLLVLGTAGYLLATAFSSKTPPPAANTIDVSADMGGFSEDEIRVKAGKPVKVRLTSLDNSHHTDGGGQHQWAVDELGVSIVAPPLGNNWATFTPDKPGVYTFYCDICCGGRANPSMQGKLVVEA
ncbi:MAG TPA: cupredoxin domain-containing protein [Anaerolineae bacterium]|nr:cupredoxin domain-containing protein [Anaerolineae bacterium]